MSVTGVSKLLLVDDRAENLIALTTVLRDVPAEIHTAGSGNEALSMMLRHRFAVVLLDVQMPEMDGFECARLMAEHEAMASTPIMFVTANHLDESDVFQGYEFGAVDYLTKPVNPGIVRSKVQTFINLENQRADLEQTLSTLDALNRERQLILDSMPAGVLSLDASGRIVFSNPRAEGFLFAASDTLEGADGFALLGWHENDERLTGESAQESPPESIGGPATGNMRRPDGSSFPAEYRLSPMLDEEGQVLGHTLFFDDITNRLQAEQALKRTHELQESNADLEQFAYVLSHDMREPLRMVGSYLSLIERRYQDKLDERGRQFIDFAVDGARRMEGMIEALLSYSRVGTEAVKPSCISGEAALGLVLKNLEVAIEESEAKVSHDPLPDLVVDNNQLQQLLQNLIANAIKYAGERIPEVHVASEFQDDGFARISITDNGIGMAPEHHERIFEIFQRLHGRDEYEGTGIGLAICKRIVDRHDGEIWVESNQGQTQGSTICFKLPATSDLRALDPDTRPRLAAG